MTADPFREVEQTVQRNMNAFSLSVARVADVPDNVQHQIKITPVTETANLATITQSTTASVAVSQQGDIALPEQGDLVVVGRFENRNPVVIGVLYASEDDVRDYSRDERHIADADIGVYVHGRYLSPPNRTDDPDNPPASAMWYRSDIDEYRGVEGGQVVSFDTTDV